MRDHPQTSVFRIADHVRRDICDRPCWTMSLSGPSLLQNATSASRRSVSQVGKETLPNWASRSVQTASKAKTVGPNQPPKRHIRFRVQTDQKLARTSNSEHWEALQSVNALSEPLPDLPWPSHLCQKSLPIPKNACSVCGSLLPRMGLLLVSSDADREGDSTPV